jgi:hypothetical protein
MQERLHVMLLVVGQNVNCLVLRKSWENFIVEVHDMIHSSLSSLVSFIKMINSLEKI